MYYIHITQADQHGQTPTGPAKNTQIQTLSLDNARYIKHTHHKLVIEVLGHRNLVPQPLPPPRFQNQIPRQSLPRRRLQRPQQNRRVRGVACTSTSTITSKAQHPLISECSPTNSSSKETTTTTTHQAQSTNDQISAGKTPGPASPSASPSQTHSHQSQESAP